MTTSALFACATLGMPWSAASVQPDAIGPLFDLLESRWVHRAAVDLPELRARSAKKWATATTDDDCQAALLVPFVAANDVHSMVTWKGQVFGHYHGVSEDVRARYLELMATSEAMAGRPFAKMGPDRVGYVFVPAMSPSSSEEMATQGKELRDQVAAVARHGPTGWIVDLRANGGGNLMPMLIGLQPLLGFGVVGGSADASGDVQGEWLLAPAGLEWKAGSTRTLLVDVTLRDEDRSEAPAVVLIGMATRSSGQALALAFVGRPQTQLLGEDSAIGHTTVNYPFRVSDELQVNRSVGYMTDRAGKSFRTLVSPDKPIAWGANKESLQASAFERSVVQALQELSKRRLNL